MFLTRYSAVAAIALGMVATLEKPAHACTSGTWTADANEAASKLRGDWPTGGARAINGPSVTLGGTYVATAGYVGHEYFIDYTYHVDYSDVAVLTSSSITSMNTAYGLSGDLLNSIFQQSGTTLPYLIQTDNPPYENGNVDCPASFGYVQESDTAYSSVTSIAFNSSGDMFITGQSGNCSHTDLPHGPCIQVNAYSYPSDCGYTSLTYLSGSPGAVQVTTDTYGSNSELYALDDSGHVWARSTAGGSSWTALSIDHCGTGTMKIDEIAAYNGYVYGIRDNSGSAGQVYSFETSNGSSGCWSPLDNSLYVVSISANPQSPTTAPVLAADANGDLYYYCQ